MERDFCNLKVTIPVFQHCQEVKSFQTDCVEPQITYIKCSQNKIDIMKLIPSDHIVGYFCTYKKGRKYTFTMEIIRVKLYTAV